MAKQAVGLKPLETARDALFTVVQKAKRLAAATERLENLYTRSASDTKKFKTASHFYVPTSSVTGRELDPGWRPRGPANMRQALREAIDETLGLRAAVDAAIDAIANVAAYMDSAAQSLDQRWTARTTSDLRALRGAILRGHAADVNPSALPMILADVPKTLRDASGTIVRRMEECKSAIASGVQPQSPIAGVTAEVLNRLDRVERAASTPSHAPLIVVLWDGAEHSARNIKLGRTRTAYLEAHGNVNNALQALKARGYPISRSTFYEHLRALDEACPNWRARQLLSGESGIPSRRARSRTRRKTRENPG